MIDPRIEAVARELHAIDCDNSNKDYKLLGLPIPEKWADPWEPHGARQLAKLRQDAARIVGALDAYSEVSDGTAGAVCSLRTNYTVPEPEDRPMRVSGGVR